jgi:hypothetical protein
MTEKFVARVPESVWAEGRPAGARSWVAEFNVASWVRVTAAGGRVLMLVRHMDAAGEHESVVDVAQVGGNDSALLSGVVRLRFQGQVEQVQVSLKLSSPDIRYEVDELFMQRRDSALGPDMKLISNF